MLIDAGCDTAATSKKGHNALIRATSSAVPAALRLALEKGWCELEARDEYGWTAFLTACIKGSVECMQLLVDAGCDTAATSKTGRRTALMLTAGSCVPAAAQLVMEKGWCEVEAR